MTNLCGKSAAADPFLSREGTMCSKQDAWTTGGSTLVERKGFAGVYFFPAAAIDFFLFCRARQLSCMLIKCTTAVVHAHKSGQTKNRYVHAL